ncbi:SixA phosphatase family protein [Mycolicibacterium mengxianglii]|uniref:SixA phosphatase family protein n=1 Tax=Mycolicibacterium mengxianglii TaxID=2736649 RepID=UPI0018D17770|nr:histidine phosphatase family protein [Mycolicibacterium mengxianglii]
MSDDRRTLILLRHAKSAYPDGVGDHDRPLAPRGEREAGLAGDWLRSGVVAPPVQAVLCSTATRTRQTLARTGIDAPVRFVDRLYGATPGGVISEINGVAEQFDIDVRTLLVVGHEPAMSSVALGLSGAPGTDAAAAEQISLKFPTSAIAVLRIEGAWADVQLGTAALQLFHVPR